ncbi:AGAP000573-PB-like protein [Anopheles sinensis]|uniref:AGAP000573-PB-like protein n=1 Tax=Anopheles sinensis TaxID=74873 RepID=A0A084VAA2_ANOSI|nr:AGAP000573-PB-like protein [Anopheles sinensis]
MSVLCCKKEGTGVSANRFTSIAKQECDALLSRSSNLADHLSVIRKEAANTHSDSDHRSVSQCAGDNLARARSATVVVQVPPAVVLYRRLSSAWPDLATSPRRRY